MVVVGLVVVGKQEVASPLPPRHYATPTTSASGPQPPGHVKPPVIAGELESFGDDDNLHDRDIMFTYIKADFDYH